MSMTVIPDFGYEQKNIVDQQNVYGWRLLYDYVRKSPKMIRLQHIIHDKVQEKKQKELNRLNTQRQKNNSRNKNYAKVSTMALPTQIDPQNGQNSENRKASAGNNAENSRSVTVKTGGDYEQGGESKVGRKITRDLDNLVQQHESHQNYIDKIKKMNLDRRRGNKT